MLIVDRQNKKLARMQTKTFAAANLLEKQDLQSMIVSASAEFFEELGEDILLVGDAIKPARYFVEDELDILAIDRQGAAVIIELKRDKDKLQLLQALSYAAMVSKWTSEQFYDTLVKKQGVVREQAEDTLDGFLSTGSLLNENQRIILIAEAFDYEVLATAEWLYTHFQTDIRCYKIELVFEADSEFLSVNRIFPSPEIADFAARRSRSLEAGYDSWESALANFKNGEVTKFFLEQVKQGMENNLKYKDIYFPLAGRNRRFSVGARKKFAYVAQWGRFSDDIQHWKSKLSEPDSVAEIDKSKGLSFRLVTIADFTSFTDSLSEIDTSTFESDLSAEDSQSASGEVYNGL